MTYDELPNDLRLFQDACMFNIYCPTGGIWYDIAYKLIRECNYGPLTTNALLETLDESERRRKEWWEHRRG